MELYEEVELDEEARAYDYIYSVAMIVFDPESYDADLAKRALADWGMAYKITSSVPFEVIPIHLFALLKEGSEPCVLYEFLRSASVLRRTPLNVIDSQRVADFDGYSPVSPKQDDQWEHASKMVCSTSIGKLTLFLEPTTQPGIPEVLLSTFPRTCSGTN